MSTPIPKPGSRRAPNGLVVAPGIGGGRPGGATGAASVTTQMELPGDLETELVVVANGIQFDPINVKVK